MARLGGKAVGALYERSADQPGPPAWLSYVTVEDADATASRSGELGATDLGAVRRHGGRTMAVLQDPTGAVFAIWQPGQSIGAELVNDPGAITMNQLNTGDPEAASGFYSELFGWRFDQLPEAQAADTDVAGQQYWGIFNGGRLNGGMMPLSQAGPGAPPLGSSTSPAPTSTQALPGSRSSGPGHGSAHADPVGEDRCRPGPAGRRVRPVRGRSRRLSERRRPRRTILDPVSTDAIHGAPVAPGADRVERLLADLNPDQREAVTHGDGPLLVLAGAGSGKTRVLTYRIAWLLATGRAQPSEVLAITFTNKAAGEMRERVAALVGGVSRAMWVMTFHSACARILRAEAPRLGYKRAFTIYDEADSLRMVKRCMQELELDPKRYRRARSEPRSRAPRTSSPMPPTTARPPAAASRRRSPTSTTSTSAAWSRPARWTSTTCWCAR